MKKSYFYLWAKHGNKCTVWEEEKKEKMLAASNKTWQNPLKLEVSQPRLIFTSNSSFNDAKQIRATLTFYLPTFQP